MPKTETINTETVKIRYTEKEIEEYILSLHPGYNIKDVYRYTKDPYDGYESKYFDGYELTKVTETK